MCLVPRGYFFLAVLFLVLYCKHDTLKFVVHVPLNCFVMVNDCFIMMANYETGEIYARSRKQIQTSQFEHREILYRWVDSLCRALEKGEKYPFLQIKFERPVKQTDLF